MSFYASLLSTIHFIFSTVLVCILCFNQVRRFVTGVVNFHHRTHEVVRKKIRQNASSLKRLPHHIGIIIGEDEISYTDIANFITWCIEFRISYITIYDHEGIIKNNSESLKKSLSSKLSHSTYDFNSPNNHFKTNKHENGYSNGKCSENYKTVLSFLSYEDGRQDIVGAAKSIVYYKKTVSNKVINQSLLEDFLKSNREKPCPELIVCCGTAFSTLGFLPWHIHLSEIMQVTSHHQITYEDFFHILQRYSKCEQRFGK